MTVTATLTVSFAADASDADQGSQLILLIDDRKTGLNGGKTSGFFPGDSVYVLRFKTSNLVMTLLAATAGGLSAAGGGNYAVEEIVTFADAREASLRLPVSGGFSYSWLGASPGAIQVVNQTKLIIPAAGFGLAKVSYQSAFLAYRLHNVPTEIEQVLVYAQAEASA